MEIKLNALRETCQLNEGLGIGSYLRRSFTGIDRTIERRVEKALKNIKTEKDKTAIIRALYIAKKDAKLVNSSKSSSKNSLWADIGSSLKMTLPKMLMGPLAPFALIISGIVTTMNKYGGNIDQFIKTIDVLIADVKAYKIPE